MTVINFPRSRTPAQRKAPDWVEPNAALFLVGALRRLGEPATLNELSVLVRAISGQQVGWTNAFLGSVLERLCETGLDDIPETPVFRVVALENGSAWAFTQPFRTLLRGVDLTAALRPLPPPLSAEGGDRV